MGFSSTKISFGLLFAAFVVLISGIVLTYGPYPKYEVATSIPGIVKVLTEGWCSGFVLDSSHIGTARHCVNLFHQNDLYVTVEFMNGARLPFRISAVGNDLEGHDVAILYGNTIGTEPLVISKHLPEMNSACFHAGFGGGNPNQMGIPCIFNKMVKEGNGVYIELMSNAVPGDSGSPVINLEHEIAGVVVRTAYPTPAAYAIPSPVLLQLYKQVLAKEKK